MFLQRIEAALEHIGAHAAGDLVGLALRSLKNSLSIPHRCGRHR